jgi:hypothetical protein
MSRANFCYDLSYHWLMSSTFHSNVTAQVAQIWVSFSVLTEHTNCFVNLGLDSSISSNQIRSILEVLFDLFFQVKLFNSFAGVNCTTKHNSLKLLCIRNS